MYTHRLSGIPGSRLLFATKSVSPARQTVRMTETDAAMLALERLWWRERGAKETAIRALGMSATAYHQRLNRLIDSPAALAHDPLVVRRLLRRRGR